MTDAPRIPTEFQYFENVNKPAIRRARKALKLVMGFDPVLPDDVVTTWASTYYDADPVAEAFVDEVYLKRGQAAGRAILDEALQGGVAAVPDAPASLVRLFAEVEQTPAWVDWKMVDEGAKVFRRWGPHLYSFAGAATLAAYEENSVAKPLAFTGTYTGETAIRRFLETAQFWVDVSAPGGIHKGGLGVKTALRVRLMHVFVRRRLLAHPKWDLAGWGVPISQGDAILTQMGGSVAPALALKALGYRTSKREIESLLHFWRYVGHLMGVQPRWYPETYEDAFRLLFCSFVKGVGKSGDDGKNLAHSYVQAFAPKDGAAGFELLQQQAEYFFELAYTSLFLPFPVFKRYGLPEPGLLRLLPFAQTPLIFAAETLRRRSKLVDGAMDSFAQWRSKRWLAAHLGEREAEYKAAEAFTR
jgi:hypothetical protein